MHVQNILYVAALNAAVAIYINILKRACHSLLGHFVASFMETNICVRRVGLGELQPPPNFLRIYPFGQKVSCHSGMDVRVIC